MAGVLKPSPGALRIIDDLEEGLAIVVNGNTAPKNIAAGQYLFIKNHSTLATGGYHATAAISNGGTISSSNVAADEDGIANSLNSNVTPERLSFILANNTSTINRSVAFKIGKLVWFSVSISTSVTLPAESAIFRLNRSNGNAIIPAIDNQNSGRVVYFSNNEYKFYTAQKSDNNYYIVCASQISANSTIIISGVFVCD